MKTETEPTIIDRLLFSVNDNAEPDGDREKDSLRYFLLIDNDDDDL